MTRINRSLVAALAFVSMIASPLAGRADTYPSKPVRMLVGYPAGGSTDIVARLICEWLGSQLGQSFYVENRPGDSNNLATQAALSAAPDGYTLYLVNASNFINQSLFPQLSFNFLRDTAPVSGILRVPQVLEVHPSVPAHSVSEFIAYAKANPGKLNMASSGVGTAIHLAGELFKTMAGVEIVHVPYKGTPPAMTDVLAGRVEVIFDTLPSATEHIRAGRLRALGVTTSERAPLMPNLPAIAETVPGYDLSSVSGVGAPRGTPPEVVDKLNAAINAGLVNPTLRARLVQLGGIMIHGSAADFGKLSVREVEMWGRVITGAKAN